MSERTPELVDLQPGYAMVPDWILTGGFSSRAVHLYGVLKRYARDTSQAFPGRERLAHDLRDENGPISLSSVDRAIRELAIRGALKVTRRGLGRTNLYALVWDDPESSRVTTPDSARVTTPDRAPAPTTESPPVPTPMKDKQGKDKQLKDNPPSPPGARAVEVDHVTPVFDHWLAVSRQNGMHLTAATRLTGARRKAIRARLNDGYSAEDLTRAVDGAFVSDFHRAHPDFLDLASLLGSGAKVDRHMARVEITQLPDTRRAERMASMGRVIDLLDESKRLNA